MKSLAYVFRAWFSLHVIYSLNGFQDGMCGKSDLDQSRHFHSVRVDQADHPASAEVRW